MSGEITLRGKVLPVGGIKEKLLAAHREGIREAILPRDNKADLKDLPKTILQSMKIHLVETMDDVLKIVLTRDLPPAPVRPEAVATEARTGETPAGAAAEAKERPEPPVIH
jgi:ATP-dependent Lon protease